MRNCPNCGAPLEPYKCRCEYCGTWYFDFTSFDLSSGDPYYVKFNTPYGVVTTLAKPELQTIELVNDDVCAIDGRGNELVKIQYSRTCDFGVVFHSIMNYDTGELFRLEVPDENYSNTRRDSANI